MTNETKKNIKHPKHKEKTIEETFRNLSGYKNSYEIIISDGGSTDRTLEIAQKYNCKIVKHSLSHRQTIAEGRNEGAFLSAGDYIVLFAPSSTLQARPERFLL